jgi:hypothetical protein
VIARPNIADAERRPFAGTLVREKRCCSERSGPAVLLLPCRSSVRAAAITSSTVLFPAGGVAPR